MQVEYNLGAALSANICGALFLVSLMITSHIIRERENRVSRFLVGMIIVCLVGCLSEILFDLVNGQMFPGARELNILAKTFNNFECVFAGFIFAGFVRARVIDEKKWPKTLSIVAAITCIFGSVLLIINLFTGIVFTISSENLYFRGPMGRIGYYLTFIPIVYASFLFYLDREKIRNYMFYSVPLSLIPFLTGSIIQMLVPSLRLSNVGFALSIMVAHLSVQRDVLYTDSMTGLFNRSFMDFYLRRLKWQKKKKLYGGLMIDINSFKNINDSFGHDMGDVAISDAAAIIKRAADEESLIMRYGGDEFIILRAGYGMEELDALKETVDSAVSDFNETSDRPYELAFAIGRAIFDPLSSTSDSFFDRMDHDLYREKRAYYDNPSRGRRKEDKVEG